METSVQINGVTYVRADSVPKRGGNSTPEPMTEEHKLIKDLVAELQPYSVAHPSHQLPALEAGHAWLLSQPPCSECGAMTPEEAETLCICSGDKDHCHGCDLWPD
jgi:hypothetical protein